MKKIKEFIKKLWNFAFHTEGGLYLVFGALTTVVSLIAFYAFQLAFHRYLLSTVFKNAAGILFAYFTNRGLVFGSTARGAKRWLEFAKFTASRLVTFALDMGLTALMVDLMHINAYVVGALSTVVVIVLNYVLSKLFVFTKGK